MTASLTRSRPFDFNYRPSLAKSGLRNRARPNLPPCWTKSSTGPFDYSPDSDPPSPSSQSSQTPSTASTSSALDWATANATIVLPTEGRQPFAPYDYQRAILEDPSPRRLILKARQTGISNTVAIEALHKAITRPDSTEVFVSRNQDAARVLIRYCRHTLNGLKDPPALASESQSELSFANGSRIVSLPATPSTGRGLAATDVYLDEFAFAEYDELIYGSIIGTIATGGRMTILSTANGRNNLYFRLWAGFEGGDWSKHEIHWSACPRYDDAWAERTKAEMTRQQFAQEFDLDFLVSGDAVFDPADLEQARIGHDPASEGCAEYIHAWDLGRRHDHTVGITLGRRGDTWHVVRYERVLVPYPVVVSMIERRHKQLPGQTVVESNGIGDPVIEHLGVRVTPFTTTAKTKVQAIQALQLLLQRGHFKHDTEQLHRELDLYSWSDDGLVTDSVMAAAFAAFAIQDPARRYAAAFGKSGHLFTPPPPPLNVREPIRDLGRLDELRALLAKSGGPR